MKNFIKKIGAVFLSLTAAASLLAGCGAKTEPAASAAPETKGTFHSVHFSCPVAFEDARAEGDFNAGTNNVVGSSTLVNGFINGAEESAVPAYQGLSEVHAFFEDVDYIGGVRDASDTWWQGWTCGLTDDAPGC